jgi:hypothetical protein
VCVYVYNVIGGVVLDTKPTCIRYITRDDGVVIPAGEGVSRPSGEKFRSGLCDAGLVTADVYARRSLGAQEEKRFVVRRIHCV